LGRIENSVGYSGTIDNLWKVGSIGYGFTGALSGQPVFYAGSGAGATWVTYEQPILTLMGTTVGAK
jgi:hypothetical protein